MNKISKNIEKTKERPPIIAVMGHIDHGKSALLDYIRKSNIVEGEAGGITQHISAYEVEHNNKKITFLDTPGHTAFTAMRLRGANIADIAILIVSAEEGPKQQTIEALESIKEAQIPFIVAINKIDQPSANIEKTKQQLLEKEVYLEGLGGEIPYTPISAKTGEGTPELLDTILLMAEMEELKGDRTKNAEGFILESNRDSKKGISATLIITNGKIETGKFIVSENIFAPIRIMENFLGQPIKEASFSSPVNVRGFKEIPTVGSKFFVYKTKKEAEKKASEYKPKENTTIEFQKNTNDKKIIPLVIKADVLGSIEALQKEIQKIKSERIILKIISTGVGNIGKNDIQNAGGNKDTIIVGFNVKIDNNAKNLAEKTKTETKVFNIIYKLTEWLEEKILEKTPKIKTEKIIGKAKILKIFSQQKNKQLIGGEVKEGIISLNSQVKISRRDFELEKGKITELQSGKIQAKEIKEGEQFGAMIEAKKEIAPGDILEVFEIVEE